MIPEYSGGVLVVIGPLFARGIGSDAVPGGLAAAIAMTASAAEARVEMVARIGDDPAGDAVLLGLAAAGVGHVATLRDPARGTMVLMGEDDPSDVDPDTTAPAEARARKTTHGAAPTLDGGDVGLALRYLADYRVIVVVHPTEAGVLTEAVAAASYSGAHLVIITVPDLPVPATLPSGALVLAAAPDATATAKLLGTYVAAVDRGEDPASAFAAMAALSA